MCTSLLVVLLEMWSVMDFLFLVGRRYVLLQVESVKNVVVTFCRFFWLNNEIYIFATCYKNNAVPFSSNFRYLTTKVYLTQLNLAVKW